MIVLSCNLDTKDASEDPPEKNEKAKTGELLVLHFRTLTKSIDRHCAKSCQGCNRHRFRNN